MQTLSIIKNKEGYETLMAKKDDIFNTFKNIYFSLLENDGYDLIDHEDTSLHDVNIGSYKEWVATSILKVSKFLEENGEERLAKIFQKTMIQSPKPNGVYVNSAFEKTLDIIFNRIIDIRIKLYESYVPTFESFIRK